MPDFSVRSDSVNVEQLMEQIRARISEKRGVDYTEEQIRELAAVKLEKFLDPKAVRSDLLQQFQKMQASSPASSNVTFGPNAIFEAKRPIIAKIRGWLRPVLRLFLNPDPISEALVRLNDIDPRSDMYYELFHNLVIELTRMSIEVKNLKMRVESLTGRLEFNERRARALESVVVYRDDEGSQGSQSSQSSQSSHGSSGSHSSRGNERHRGSDVGGRREQGYSGAQNRGAHGTQPSAPPSATPNEASTPATPGGAPGAQPEGPGQRSRRRRRRRGRRGGGGSAASLMGGAPGSPTAPEMPGETGPQGAADSNSEGSTFDSDSLPDTEPEGPDDPESGEP